MKKWIVAVSGGSDSMMLLDLCIKHQLDIIVAHVNYQKRASAIKESEGVRAYCQRYDVVFEMVYAPKMMNGNFQKAARDFRYRFFKQLVERYDAMGVLIAHQQDDVLETYLMQLKRGSVPQTYGIKKDIVIDGLRIVRPLLSVSKAESRAYCENNAVPYFDDESNFADDYTRNRIRHRIVEKLDREQRQQLLEEIRFKNESKKEEQLDCIQKDKLLSLNHDEQVAVIRQFLLSHQCYHLSQRYIENLLQICKKGKNFKLDCEGKVLACSYGVLEIYEERDYAYTFDRLEVFECEYFKICEQGRSVCAASVTEADFPIMIRNARNGDFIQLRYGKKALNRFFIDRKVSHKNRQFWPVVVNCMGNVILVSEIGCDVQHYTDKPNLFVLK